MRWGGGWRAASRSRLVAGRAKSDVLQYEGVPSLFRLFFHRSVSSLLLSFSLSLSLPSLVWRTTGRLEITRTNNKCATDSLAPDAPARPPAPARARARGRPPRPAPVRAPAARPSPRAARAAVTPLSHGRKGAILHSTVDLGTQPCDIIIPSEVTSSLRSDPATSHSSSSNVCGTLPR